MSIDHIRALFAQSPQLRDLRSAMCEGPAMHQINGLYGSAISFFIAEYFLQESRPFLVILPDKEEAAYILNDLEALLSVRDVLFYPGSYRRPYQIEEPDNANILMRTECLNRINSDKKLALIVTYSEAIVEKVMTRKELARNTISLKTGDRIGIDFLNETLFEYHFRKTDFVTEPGEFSLRGGILDVFSYSIDEAYRIEFFGDEIESIRNFDVETQLSIKIVKKISLIPNLENKSMYESRQSFLSYLNRNSLIWIKDPEGLEYKADQLFLKAHQTFSELNEEISYLKPSELFCDSESLRGDMKSLDRVIITQLMPKSEGAISFHARPQPSFNRQFDLLISDLEKNSQIGMNNFLCCSSEQQAKRFHDIFDDLKAEVNYHTPVISLFRGFFDEQLGVACYTDHEIFDRYHRFHLRNGYAKKQAFTLKSIANLEIGDYVVHIDHGIGQFAGLQKIDAGGSMQETIKLIYGDRDILFVSIHSLHKVSKYSGKDSKPPKIYKLGSNAWKNLKQKTKARVKKIAYDLIRLYAKRRMQEGYAFAPDTYLQHELEASFIYEDTPDQGKTTEDVKRDMESPRPMDRLVCGDVGFGKTEVAIRAAFKAVDSGKQVAVLVPTTILAFQHFRTFSDRLQDFPVTINYLNRFRSSKDRSSILKGLADGSLDIVIGTHQLVSKSVVFKDLGLLIVDEEQKFGVGVKDKLKTLRENVDTLTLTATPIPRTLQFSLMAARDLSVITTPPPNRYPIETRLIQFNEESIRDAISYEIQRNGQIFFVHNRIENIAEVAEVVKRLVPDARIAIGHGQMKGEKLEAIMLDFMSGAYDVLVATTIIESGLDVPNANTIFINNAHHFGLSDLHQMRGRVGRSNKKAFCYFIAPPYSDMTDEARKRIQALEQYSELGSGLQIAMKDLEIRGAGDLLGAEQSGFINEIGFDTYQKILSEAIDELKEDEFKELYSSGQDDKEYVRETVIDTDFQLQFPDKYLSSITERLSLYTELSNIKTKSDLDNFEKKLIDRFGALPTQAVDLLNSLRLKWLGNQLGLERIVMKKGKLTGYFIADQESGFYRSKNFEKTLQFVQNNPTLAILREKQTRNGLYLILGFENINSVEKAVKQLQSVAEFDLSA